MCTATLQASEAESRPRPPARHPEQTTKASDRRLRHAVEEIQPLGIQREAKPVVDFRFDDRLRGRTTNNPARCWCDQPL